MHTLYALFPFDQVDKGSRIIIYGAGKSGLNFLKQVQIGDFCKVICIVDKDSKKHNAYIKGMEVLKKEDSYDAVVVSPLKFSLREQIKKELVEYGVKEEKIIIPSRKNLIYWSLEGDVKQEIDRINMKDYDAIEISARELVSADRLDIGIKWLLIRDLINNVENPVNRALYAKHIFAWTQGQEDFRITSTQYKDGIETYIAAARNTIQSIKENRFYKENAVPISERNEPLDGVHRIASCIEADVPIWVKKVPGLQPKIKPYTWYYENGFSTEDMQRVLRAFCDLYLGDFGFCIMHSSILGMWEYVTKQMDKNFKVVGYIDFSFEKSYMSFEVLMRDIYSVDEDTNNLFEERMEKLKENILGIRVIIVSDENDKEKDIYGRLVEFEKSMNTVFFSMQEDDSLTINCSKNKEDAVYLSKVLLSPNNVNNLKKRFWVSQNESFLKKLKLFKKCMKLRDVSLDNVCVIGNSVMEVLGISKANSIDFICLEEEFEKLKDLTQLSLDDNEGTGMQLILMVNFTSEEMRRLIMDDNCHFLCEGIKFLNLEYVKVMCELRGSKKSEKELRLIHLYEEMEAYYGQEVSQRELLWEKIKKKRG